MVKNPEHYPYSSYRTYIFYEKNDHVQTKRFLSYFPQPHSFHYQQFVEKEDELP